MLRFLVLAATAVWCSATSAASLQISPVIVTLSAADTAAYVHLDNVTERALYGQVRVFRWDQTIDEDVLANTDAIVASPPLIQIAAGRKQLIRLVRTDHEPIATEQAYRILIDEIPSPEDPSGTSVAVRLRYSVPLFVSPLSRSRAVLGWDIHSSANGSYLLIRNEGARRAQIAAVEVVSGKRRYLVSSGLLGYALAGRTRQWKLPAGVALDARSKVRVHATVNGRKVEAALAQLPSG
jgi:fimbrial chaperone protein